MEEILLLFHHSQGYLRRVNPGPIRAPFTLFWDLFCHIPAKNRTLLHTFSKYVISLGIKANGVISFEL